MRKSESSSRISNDMALYDELALIQGNRVHLDLSRLEAYSLVPGEVVAVKGINATGERFTAKQIINSAQLSQCGETKGKSFRMCLAWWHDNVGVIDSAISSALVSNASFESWPYIKFDAMRLPHRAYTNAAALHGGRDKLQMVQKALEYN